MKLLYRVQIDATVVTQVDFLGDSNLTIDEIRKLAIQEFENEWGDEFDNFDTIEAGDVESSVGDAKD